MPILLAAVFVIGIAFGAFLCSIFREERRADDG